MLNPQPTAYRGPGQAPRFYVPFRTIIEGDCLSQCITLLPPFGSFLGFSVSTRILGTQSSILTIQVRCSPTNRAYILLVRNRVGWGRRRTVKNLADAYGISRLEKYATCLEPTSNFVCAMFEPPVRVLPIQ